MSKQEFKEWCEKNRRILAKRDQMELAEMALACGFSLSDISDECTDWISQSQAKLRLWTSPFHEKWVKVWMVQNGHDDE